MNVKPFDLFVIHAVNDDRIASQKKIIHFPNSAHRKLPKVCKKTTK